MANKLPVSVIIPTYFEDTRIPVLLNSIKEQTCQSFEEIVSDGFSKDNTRENAKNMGTIVAAIIAGIGNITSIIKSKKK